jgi:small subunit ribosomal protein S4
MGSIKKIRKKYQTPSHPWQKDRIVEERELVREYGLKNKKELWKMSSLLTKFKNLAKRYITLTTTQSQKESEQLIIKLRGLGLLNETSTLNDILILSNKDILERRLQTVVSRRGLANSVKQSRQFIVHGHIKVDGKQLSSPAYMIKKAEEEKIEFTDNSSFHDVTHPERTVTKKEKKEHRPEPRDKGRRRDRNVKERVKREK